MSSSIVISFNEKILPIRYDTEFCEVSLTALKEFFQLNDQQVVLSEFTSSYELAVSPPLVRLEDGTEGYHLQDHNGGYYKLCILEAPTEEMEVSILTSLQKLPLFSSLHVAFSSAQVIHKTEELPTNYDGYCIFELPPCKDGSTMRGMEQRLDGHVWTTYKTCSVDAFRGMVRLSKCCGHLRCYNIDCAHADRYGVANETQWKGKLQTAPPVGPLNSTTKFLICKHCGEPPECIKTCEAFIYYCIPRERDTTRCVIHMGFHNHPIARGSSKKVEDSVQAKVALRASIDPSTSCKQIEVSVTRDIIMDLFVKNENESSKTLTEVDLHEALEQVTPLSQKARVRRSIQVARKDFVQGDCGLDAIIRLKQQCLYPFIQSVLFPHQLGDDSQPHVFKMSTKCPGSGVDLVNRMRPGGSLEGQWVHFDHVHRVKGWCTMGAHVYDPSIRELLTIATCEFKVQDQHAQVQFWRMLNDQMKQNGFPPPEFRGFMSDEAQSNWIAVRTVYFGGPQNKVENKERSCKFHWELNMVDHTRKCIKPAFQEEHKYLCREWQTASSEIERERCKQAIQTYWTDNHVVEGQLQSLQLWLAWWDARASHWADQFLTQHGDLGFVPSTNLSESKHASLRAAHGAKKYVSLYEATAVDLCLAVQQSAKYKSFMEGKYHGTGPDLKQLADRLMGGHGSRALEKKVIDLTTSVVDEVGLTSSEYMRRPTENISVRQKRKLDASTPIHETDSHRPEYGTFTTTRSVPQWLGFKSLVLNECEVADSNWAIRRTSPKAKVSCFGLIPETGERCGLEINVQGRATLSGVPAPCFKGRRKFPGGTHEQFIWFCSTNVQHSWNVHGSIVSPPGPAPGVWPITSGTTLSIEEISSLRRAGFVLGDNSQEGSIQQQSRIQPPPSGARPQKRDGRMVKWRSKLTKDFKEKINLANAMKAVVLRESMILPNEVHVFFLETEGSKAQGISYSVTIGQFPRCTCEDFVKRDAKTCAYIPCKHIYYIFLRTLGLDASVHQFMHQAALSNIELFQALHGRRVLAT